MFDKKKYNQLKKLVDSFSPSGIVPERCISFLKVAGILNQARDNGKITGEEFDTLYQMLADKLDNEAKEALIDKMVDKGFV